MAEVSKSSHQTKLADQIFGPFGIAFTSEFAEHFGGTPQHLSGIVGLLIRCKDLPNKLPDHCDAFGAAEFRHDFIGLENAWDRVSNLLLHQIKLSQVP